MFQNCNFELLDHRAAFKAWKKAEEEFRQFVWGNFVGWMSIEQYKEYRAERLRLESEVRQAEETWIKFLTGDTADLESLST